MGIWVYVKKIWSSGVSPKKASKMELRDVDLRSVCCYINLFSELIIPFPEIRSVQNVQYN